ncbi:MAG TPA: hypothetical protein VLL52_22785 [Anaerolineae bacterium]|nr:hypothetical protein [Anaerolineae bacterium]
MMEGNVIVFVVGALVLLAVFALYVYRNNGDVSVKGPWGTGVEAKGKPEAADDGIEMEGIEAGRDVVVDDRVGDRLRMKTVKANRGDVLVSREKGTIDPKE